MPTAQQFLDRHMALRLFIYGNAKMKKTWWALKAAEAGFRVLLFDANRGAGILTQINPAARERIYILDCADAADNAYAQAFIGEAFKSQHFYFNEETRRVSSVKRPGFREINMKLFGRETVVVVDSYTDIVHSLTRRFADDNNIDLGDAQKPDWEGYGWCARRATWMIKQINKLACHVILIGHATQYEKYKKDSRNPKKQGELEFSRRQPISTSNPHGMSVTGDFTDVFYFYAEHGKFLISSEGDIEKEAGSRLVPPAKYDWDKLQFVDLCRVGGIPLPEKSADVFDFPVVPELMQPAAVVKPTELPVIQPQTSTDKVKTGNLTTLLRR